MKIYDDLVVLDNKEIIPDHYIMEIMCPEIALSARPGQFVQVKCADLTDPLLRRPFSIFDVNIEKKSISIVYKILGNGTMLLSQKKPQDRISIVGPLGNFFSVDEDISTCILVGGGVGIAPIHFLANLLAKTEKKVKVFIGATDKERLLGKTSFQKMGIELATMTDDGSCGRKGSVCELLHDYLSTQETLEGCAVYTCGPEPMLNALKPIVQEYTTLPVQVSLEAYMGCGIGVCMSCVHKMIEGDYKSVCKDGPVFELRDVEF